MVYLEQLPEFIYHPNPLQTGSIEASAELCACCSRGRGYIYTGPIYCEMKLEHRLCPWCIADGTAAEKFNAEYCAVDAPQGIGLAVINTITRRTPGFYGWQQERWLFHCNDGAAFLGAVGRKELEGDESALASLREELAASYWTTEQVEHYLSTLDRVGQPTAYLFECRSCRTHLAYSDFT